MRYINIKIGIADEKFDEWSNYLDLPKTITEYLKENIEEYIEEYLEEIKEKLEE